MKTLNLEQMGNIKAGGLKWLNCGLASLGLAAAFVGLATLTVASGGLAIGAAVVGFSVAPAAWGLSCFTD
jgi:hypothetical protein